MSTEKLLLKAKSQLTLKHPYFGMLASRLKHESSDTIRGYASNGVRFLYNPEFISKRSIDEVMFILTNCVMHHILAHQQRRLNRKGSLWQLATDYAINNMLHQNGLHIPQGANFNEEYQGMYAEEIYDLIKEAYFGEIDDAFNSDNNGPNDNLLAPDNANDEQNCNESGDFSNLNNIEDDLDSQTESEWQYAASISQELAQRKSAMPSGLDRLAKKMQAHDIDWRFELYNAINRHMRNNYAFMPPNKKHIHRGFILPSLTSDTLSLCVAIDTSGSINDELLGIFMEEFKTIMQNFPAVQIELIIADAKVHAHYTFQGGEKMDFPLKGGGGTDYRPVFDYIDSQLPLTTMLLYFTDGDGWYPKRMPSYEVLWALSRPHKVPFGRPLMIL
ncbi:VWA-like domain-containing protein [Sulfurovum sp. zt1-1]|uniref:VWA-like domain-containing protein n=1 Tax=Sulfurovum zhangzhouensis TaxID=3019067 RepID=A0ABT7QVI8_9BACT|nr:VWA-like domain-containing protein [Sulfurovum zhangzhouensis]MDM5270855.1 VWA-like domain-containing protein [Sulfurovum zhangzhouensis]